MTQKKIDPSQKEIIRHDIEHLYLAGLTTMKSLSKTYNISLQQLAAYEKEIIDEMIEKNKNKKYFPIERELMLGELAMGETFIPKEYEGTKVAHRLYKTIEVSGKNILVENSEGKPEWMLNTIKVIIKNDSTEQGSSTQ